MKYQKQIVKVDNDSPYNWKFVPGREINIKRFIRERLPEFNTGDIIRVDTPTRTQCYIIVRK